MADDRLTPGDIAVFPILIRIQNDIGPGVTPLTQAGVLDFMAQLDVLAKQFYPQIHNAHVKAWVDGIFTPLISTLTVYQCSVTGLYILSAWGRWLADKPLLISETQYFIAFLSFELAPSGNGQSWKPETPGYWCDAVDSVFWGWGGDGTRVEALFWNGPWRTIEEQLGYIEGRFAPSQWTDVGAVSEIVGKVVGPAQSTAVHALLTDGVLSLDAALLLPWLLLFMVTFSGTADQRLAGKILSASTSSPEYPNDIFANQLIYYMLMTLADPKGNFAWPNETLQRTLQSLIAVIRRDDPASVT